MKYRVIKHILYLVLTVVLAFTVFACGKNRNADQPLKSTQELFNLDENINKRKVAVIYFSLNDDTKEVAEKLKEALDADLVEIVPKTAYTEEDLDYNNPDSRVRLEAEFNPFGEENVLPEDDYIPEEDLIYLNATRSQAEKKKTITELPEIEKIDSSSYQIIVLGFPVWYENAPKVIYTFIKDLKNKIIVPFCTGGEMGMIDQYLSNFADISVRVMSGKRFDKDVSVDELKKWVTTLSADFDVK
jgi:flavodoxin